MVTLTRSSAFMASQTLAAQGVAIQRSQLSEVIAALLGYGTYAALLADSRPGGHPIEAAELYVLSGPLGQARAKAVSNGSPKVDAIIQTCVEAIRTAAAPRRVFVGVEAFVQEHLVPEITASDEVADAIAGSNASYPDELELDQPPTASGHLWATSKEWTIVLSGELTGESDLEGGRMYNGNTIAVSASVTYTKSGRAGLVKIDEEIGAAADEDSWRDEEM